jgi:hypothetical protein
LPFSICAWSALVFGLAGQGELPLAGVHANVVLVDFTRLLGQENSFCLMIVSRTLASNISAGLVNFVLVNIIFG